MKSFLLMNSNKREASVSIYKMLGQRVNQFIALLNNGRGSIVWDGKDSYQKSVASGTYFYYISDSNNSIVKKMLLIK